MVSVCYAVDGRSVVIIGRGGHPCVALICSVARIAEKKRLMRSTVAKGDIQLIMSNVSVRNIGQSALRSWLNQLISDCRSSQTSLNHLNFFGWTPRNSSDLVAGVGLAKSDLGRITSNQPKGGRKLTIKAVGSTMFVPTTNQLLITYSSQFLCSLCSATLTGINLRKEKI